MDRLPKPRIPMPRTPPKPEVDLVALVKDYINEMANPAPDFTMRMVLRARLAKAVGMEDPVVSLRKWNKK